MKYLEAERRVQHFIGLEIIEFAGTAWRVDSVYELASGDYQVVCLFDDRRMVFDVPYDQPVACLIPEEES